MALKSDDSDLEKTWLRTFFGGNGDYYVQITWENEDGIRDNKCVRISTSGGYTKDSNVKVAISKLHWAMEEAELNDFVDE